MRWRRSHIQVVAALAATLAALVGAGTAFAAAPTSIHLYSPFNGDLVAKGIKVTKSAPGSCWEGSIADPRSDAYRCLVGNEILDPCFGNDIGPNHYVLCPLYIPGAPVFRINLTKKLPANTYAPSDPTSESPWLMLIAGGRWCGAITGATGTVGGLPMSYGCGGGGVLLGKPNRRGATWTMLYAPSMRASSYRAVTIKQAWW